ncbi:unnamed protein product, partial [Mesorhabditis belari]|uniref:mitogen-activated protein kinase kinase n=1 Tax=Mesorhabditis belari TaxID=2138241 RepID=A0AAF3J7M0_9BILA
MSSGKRRNPLGLSLPPTVSEQAEREDAKEEEDVVPARITIDEQLMRLGLTEPQKQRMEEWVAVKEGIAESDLSEDFFETLGELGHGNGGVVNKVRHKQRGIIMARKLVHLEVKPSVRTQILKELAVLHKCNSPFIVGFYGAFVDNNDISICMEYMNGLSLDIVLQRMGRLQENFVGRVSVAVVRGLTYLKDEIKILHRDVKPSNMLVNTAGEIKLCDFGVSGVLVDSMANSFVGTRSYMAPERLTGSQYSILSDIWSFGLSLIELLVGKYPVPAITKKEFANIFQVPEGEIVLADERSEVPTYQSSTSPASMAIFEMLDYIVNGPAPTLPRNIFTDECVDFVSKCLKKVPVERANLKTLAAHPFFQRYTQFDDNGEFAAFVAKTVQIGGGN